MYVINEIGVVLHLFTGNYIYRMYCYYGKGVLGILYVLCKPYSKFKDHTSPDSLWRV